MSYRSSFAHYLPSGGRSPYGSYVQPQPEHPLSSYYDYVDENHNVVSPISARYTSANDDDDEPDKIHISYRGQAWSLDFPPFSIAEEKVLVRHVRERVASRLGLEGHEGRIKLMYKEQELGSNERPLRSYGCKQNSEIVVIVLQEPKNWDRKHQSGSENESVGSARRSVEEVRPRRSNSTYRRRDHEPQPAPERRNGRLHPDSAQNTPPTGHTPPRQPSPHRQNTQRVSHQSAPDSASRVPAVPRPTGDPISTLYKIQNIRYEFYTEWYPKIDDFLRNPPQDADERTKEYRRLGEIVYKRVFEAGDAIEPDGPDKDEIRATRKKLFSDAHEILKDLDRFKPRE